MIAWKIDLDNIIKELRVARKRIDVLEDLLGSGKISQSTYDYLRKDFEETLNSVEERRKHLADQMVAKAAELEQQSKGLEMCLATIEIQRVTNEIDDESYATQIRAILAGLEITKNELKALKDGLETLTASEMEEVEKMATIVAPTAGQTSTESVVVGAPMGTPPSENTYETPAETTIETAVVAPTSQGEESAAGDVAVDETSIKLPEEEVITPSGEEMMTSEEFPESEETCSSKETETSEEETFFITAQETEPSSEGSELSEEAVLSEDADVGFENGTAASAPEGKIAAP